MSFRKNRHMALEQKGRQNVHRFVLRRYRVARRHTRRDRRWYRRWENRCRSMFWKDFVEGSSPDATLGQSLEAFEEFYGIFGIRNVERMHKEVLE